MPYQTISSYCLTINTKGSIDYMQSNNQTELYKFLQKTLQETTIEYQETEILKLRTFQNKLKNIPINDFDVFKIYQSIIKIENYPIKQHYFKK